MKRDTIQKVDTDNLVLGVDIGGTRIKCAWFNTETGLIEGTHLFSTRDCTTAEGTPAFAEDVCTQIQEVEKGLGKSFVAVGVAAPGLASRDQRTITCMPGRLGGLENLDWSVLLRRNQFVPVLNDAHAALLGEVWQGAARGLKHAVMVTLGTGVGGAVLSDGRLMTGFLGRAGHLGHVSLERRGPKDIVGTPGSLEDAIGECTLLQRSDGFYHSTLQLILAVKAGNMGAQLLWMDSVDALAASIVSFINAFDPERVVIGGGIAQAGDTLFKPLQSRLDEIEWRPLGRSVPVVPAKLNDWGGACGAAWNALNSLSARDFPCLKK